MHKARRLTVLILALFLLCPIFLFTASATDTEITSAEATALDASYENAYGGAKAIVSLTFDDSVYTSATLVQEMCEKYGMEATMMMWVSNIGATGKKYADAATWAALFAKGQLEPQNHSYSHIDLRSSTATGLANQSEENYQEQIVDAKKKLEEYFPGYDIIGFAPAFGSLSAEAKAVATKHHYAIRGVSSSGIQSLDPASYTTGGHGSWISLYSPSVVIKDSDGIVVSAEEQLAALKTRIDNTVAAGGWYCPFIHRVGDEGGAEMTAATTDAYFAYIAEYRDNGDVWVTKFSNAVKYIRERQSSTLTAYESDGTIYVSSVMAETTSDGLPLSADVFNQPLTARVALPGEAYAVTYELLGETRYAKTEMVDGTTYALIDVLPDGTETVVTTIAGSSEMQTVSTAEAFHASITAANTLYQQNKITLDASITTTEAITIDAEGADITVDLNGQTLTIAHTVTLKNGTLTLKNGKLCIQTIQGILIPEDGAKAKLVIDGVTSAESDNKKSPTFDFRSGEVVLNHVEICRISNIASADKNLQFEFAGAANAWFASLFRLRGDCNMTVTNSHLEIRTTSGVVNQTNYFRTVLATDIDHTGTVTFDNSAIHGARISMVLYGTGTVNLLNGSKVISQTFTHNTAEDKSVAMLLGPDAIKVNVENSTVSANWQAIASAHSSITASPVVTLKGATVAATNCTANKNANSAIFAGHTITVIAEDSALLGEALFSNISVGVTNSAYLSTNVLGKTVTFAGEGLLLRVSGELQLPNELSADHVNMTPADGLFLAKRAPISLSAPYVHAVSGTTVTGWMSKNYTKTASIASAYIITENAVKIGWDYLKEVREEYWVTGETPLCDGFSFTLNGNTYFAEFENVTAATEDAVYRATSIAGGPQFSANITLYAAIDFNVYIPVTAAEITHIGDIAVTSLPVVTENNISYYKYAFDGLAPKDAYKSQAVILTVRLSDTESVKITRYVSILGYAKALNEVGMAEEIAVVKAAMNYINETRKYFYLTTEEIGAISDYLGEYTATWDGAGNVLTVPTELATIRGIALNLDAMPGFAVFVDHSYTGQVSFGEKTTSKLELTELTIDGIPTAVRCAIFDIPVHKMLESFTVAAGGDSFSYNLDTYISSVAAQEGFAAALYDYATKASLYMSAKEDLYYVPSAEIVNKNNAEGVVSYVIDDNDKATATYANSLLDKYSNLTLSYAVRTRFLATLLTEEGEDGLTRYQMTNDDKYVYEINETLVDFWRSITESERVELINHTHTHAFWGTNDDGGEFKYFKNSDLETVLTSTQPVGSSSKELYASMQILSELFGDLDPKSTLSFIEAGIGVYTGSVTIDNETIPSYSSYFNSLISDAIATGKLATSRETFQKKTTDSADCVVTKDHLASVAGRAAVEAYMILNANAGENIENWTAYIDHALEQGGWAPFCIHLITENEHTSHHILQSQADALFAYTASLGDRVWVATYTDASLYFCEWSTANVTVDYTEGALTVTLTDEENNEIFDMPLTVKVSVPPSWDGAMLGDTPLTIHENDDGTRYVLVDIVPDSGSVVIVKA